MSVGCFVLLTRCPVCLGCPVLPGSRCVIYHRRGHRDESEVEKRVADCSSVSAGTVEPTVLILAIVCEVRW